MEEDGDVCVAPKDCPVTEPEQECPEGMVYQECGTACPTTCDNKDDLLQPCTLECVQGTCITKICCTKACVWKLRLALFEYTSSNHVYSDNCQHPPMHTVSTIVGDHWLYRQ